MRTMHSPPRLEYGKEIGVSRISLVENAETFDRECNAFVDSIDGKFREPFLQKVAQPMMAAFRAHKQRKYSGDQNALSLMDRVWADDWRAVGKQWIEKRMLAWVDKNKNVYTERESERQKTEH